MPFRRLSQPTVFISASRDMRLEASVAIDIVEAIAQRHPVHRNLTPYLWSDQDKPWFGDSTWQEQIPRPSDPMVVAVICLFGERLGSPLPPYFPLPDDLPLPDLVQFPWHGAAGKIPLTGTLFEYLDARNTRGDSAAGAITPKLLVYFRGEARKLASDLPADQRDWGYWRHYDEISQARRHSGLTEYFEQIGHLTDFFDRLHRPGERGCTYLAPDLENFRNTLRRDLADLLGLSATRRAFSSLRGLEAYDVGDTEIFAGRSRSIDKIFREIERQDATDQGATGALIVGASGAGKSSVLRAGLIGEAASGARNTLERSLRALVVTPQELGDAHPLATLGARLAGPGVLPELGRADDLQQVLEANPGGAPELLVARIAAACAAAAETEQIKSRHGVRPIVRLIVAIDQVDQLVESDTDASIHAPLLRFLIEGARRRIFWFVGSLADARLDRWNRLLGEHSSLLAYWPLGNPDWEALSEIVDVSFDLLQLPLDPRLKNILISSCRSIDREGAAILPLLSVAMTRLAEALRREFATLARGTFEAAAASGEGAADGRYLDLRLADDVIERLKDFADIKSAINELAEQGRHEALKIAARQGDAAAAQIGPLLRHLVAVRPGATVESISLVACLLQDPAVLRARPLVEALRKRRIITDLRGDHIRIVHEAVIRHWHRAATWFDQTQRALGLVETIRPLAHLWASAPDRLKSAMLLPAGYCLEVQGVMVDWDGDAERLPMPFIRASMQEHASSVVNLGSEHGWYPLGVAALLGEIGLVQTFLDAGAEPALGGPDGVTPLHVANDVAIATALLDRGAAIDARDASGASPLHAAALRGRTSIIAYLLDAACDSHALDATGSNALHRAASGRHHAAAEVLLSKDLDPNAYNNEGETPFTTACKLGDPALMSMFLAAGADATLCQQSRSPGDPPKPPLVLAVESGELACVQMLVGPGVASQAGASALLVAAPYGADLIVRQLIQSGAPIDCAEIETGFTPLYLAAQSGHESVVAILLAAGADPQAFGNNGLTVLHAATSSRKPAIVQQILAAGAPTDRATAGGETALHVAAQNKNIEIIALLLQNGARTELEDRHGFTALGRAADHRDAAAAAALLQAGSAALKPNSVGLSPLDIAARHGHLALMDLIAGAMSEPAIGPSLTAFAVHSSAVAAVARAIELGSPVDAPDARGMTPLHYAAWNALDEIVALLLAKGADPNRRGPDGWSPLMFAAAVIPELQEPAAKVIAHLLAAGASPAARDAAGRDAPAIARLFGLDELASALRREPKPLLDTVA